MVAGRYRILSMLGRGGVGVVYKALDVELGEDVALKVFTISGRDPAELDNARREARLARNITHANVIRIYEFGTAGTDAFISMELLPGGTLADRIRAGLMKIEDAIEIAIGICEGLAAAHQLGIVHRDIKPENVLFDALGRPKVVDFGLARFGNATTRTVGFSGTPYYMSPEQANSGEITVRSDVYSLGVLLFELFTGRPPFLADSIVQIAMMHLNDPPPAPKSIRPELPEEIVDVVLRSLQKEPSKRYQSVTALADGLKAARASTLEVDLSQRKKRVTRERPVVSVPGGIEVPVADDDNTRKIVAPVIRETKNRTTPPEVPQRHSGQVSVPRSRFSLYAAAGAGGTLAVLLILLAARGVFNEGVTMSSPTPAPTGFLTSTASPVETITHPPSTPSPTPSRTPSRTPIRTQTPTQVVVVTPQTPTPQPIPRKIEVEVGVKPNAKVFIDDDVVTIGGLGPPRGVWSGAAGRVQIRVEHRRNWSGRITFDRSQTIEIDANEGRIKAGGKVIQLR